MAAIGATCFAPVALAAPVRLAGCADAGEVRTRGIRLAPAMPPAGGDAALLTLRVFERARSGQPRIEQRAICPGATLASGAQLWLDIKVGRPVYLYVVVARQDGSATLIYPPAGQLLLAPADSELTVPSIGDVFELDDVIGEERFWVVATEGPLRGSDAELAALMKRLADQPASETVAAKGPPSIAPMARRRTPEPITPRPGPVTLAARDSPRSKAGPDVAQLHTRGIIVKRDETTLEAWTPDRAGVVMAPFWLRHVARR